MATPRLVTVDEFTQSPYAQLIESNPDLEPEDVLAKAEAAIESRLGRTVSAAVSGFGRMGKRFGCVTVRLLPSPR